MSPEILQEPTRSVMVCRRHTYQPEDHSFHWHEHYELFQPLDRPCRFLVNGQTICAQPGDLIAIHEQAVHRLIVDHGDTQARIVQFPVGILLAATPSIHPLQPHIRQEQLDALPQVRSALEQLFGIMEQEYRVPLSQQSPFQQSLCAAVYFLLMRHFAAEEVPTASGRQRSEFYRVVDYINNNYTANINVQIIASSLYIPRGRLAQLFRKYSGMDLNDYINSLRIKQVNQLLLQGAGITHAAAESGFQSIRTFNNTYRTHMGMTPTEFLRSLDKS